MTNAVCLVIDRLHVGYLGCYGNTWIATPRFDRLATEGFVFDRALVVEPTVAALYRDCWSLRGGATLSETLAKAGVSTTVVTDDSSVGQGMPGFSQRIEVEPLDLSAPAGDEADTHLARFFAESAARLTNQRAPFLLWLHTRGLGGSWDAPRAMRDRYAEEDDLPPPAFVEVPSGPFQPDEDPDRRWQLAQAYGSQVTLLDACLGMFLDQLRSCPSWDDTLFIVTLARGFPLGEHGGVGDWQEHLHVELVHVPLLLRLPDGARRMDRTPALVSSGDLSATLIDWFGASPGPARQSRSLLPLVRGETTAVRDRLCLTGAAEQAIRTPAWHMRLKRDAGEQRASLYAKPDDFWEQNDVAGRCPDVVDLLKEALADGRRFEQGELDVLPPLADVLVRGFT